MVNLLKQKPKAEPKPVNLDFTIPDYRQDRRYLAAQAKLNELQGQVRQIERQIDSVKKEIRIDSTSERAEKMLRGEPTAPSQDKRLSEYHDRLRVVRRAAELMETDISRLRNTICADNAKNPELAEHVAVVFRKTGKVMSELFDALKDEDMLLTKLTSAGLAAAWGGLSSGRAEWVHHPIFKSMKLIGFEYGDNPLRQYLQWNRKHFGDTK
jgi:hypothetical protein